MPCATTPTSSARRSTSWSASRARPTASRRSSQPLGAERTRAIGERLVDTLVDLHAVDPAAVGLGDFGRPEGFLDRQVRRWGKQLDASRSRELPGIDELHDAARRGSVPAPGRPDDRARRLPARQRPRHEPTTRSSAVLDWEMATLGDPLTDVGAARGLPAARRCSWTASPSPTASRAPGFTPARELRRAVRRRAAAATSATSGSTSAFAYFKLAVILEGIHYRYTHGPDRRRRLRPASARPRCPARHGTASPAAHRKS